MGDIAHGGDFSKSGAITSKEGGNFKILKLTLDQARGLVRFCKSTETYTYMRKNLLLFQLKKTLLS